ncbi:MAG: 50S ribosomal protein L24 [Candidatus Saccharibacteria bacterium]
MKLRKDDEIVVITGKYKGQTGKVLSVYPTDNKVLVEGINIVKRHTKPSTKNPRGGILDITKPIDASKVMILDPATKMPARIGYTFAADGTKERIFKISPNRKDKPAPKAAKKAVAKDETEAKAPVEKKAPAKKAATKKTEEKN